MCKDAGKGQALRKLRLPAQGCLGIIGPCLPLLALCGINHQRLCIEPFALVSCPEQADASLRAEKKRRQQEVKEAAMEKKRMQVQLRAEEAARKKARRREEEARKAEKQQRAAVETKEAARAR